MKKSLAVLLALTGLATAETTLPEVGTVITYTSDLSTGNEGGGSYAGVIFTLNPVKDTNRFDYDLGAAYTMPTVLELTSVTIEGRSGNYNASALQMVVIDDDTKKIVGISNGDAQGFSSTNRNMTFTFSDVRLSTVYSSTTNSKWYRALFVSDATADSLTLNGTVSSTVSTPLAAQGDGYSTTNNGGGADWGFVNGTSSAVASTGYVPHMTITTKVVPEPTTATLSLLALAGLAARRRRK